MDDYAFKHYMREKLADEYLAGAAWAIRMMGDRMHTKPVDSPERLELARVKNAIQGQMSARRKALVEEYKGRGL
jgi:hypothetical protein